jgi:uncharacterized phage-associated protein
VEFSLRQIRYGTLPPLYPFKLNMKVIDLIEFITWYATENEISLTTVRLVKFVYLADVYFARKHEGDTLTHFPWAFVNYGPYCRQVMEEIDKAVSSGLIDRRSFESHYAEGKEYHIYLCRDERVERITDEIPLEVLSPLTTAIMRYGDDTAQLLDHVYFETEPMIDALKGDILNFSKCRPLISSASIAIKKIPKEKIEIARQHIKSLVEKSHHGRMKKDSESREIAKFKDDIYYKALEMMDEEDLRTGLEGSAKIVR